MTVSKEYKLGLLALLGAVLIFISVNYIKSGLSFGSKVEYYAIFDNASGLKPENEVQLNGVKIGEVIDVGLLPQNPQLVLAKFSVTETDLKIPKSSQAWLISSDVLGTKCIDLRLDLSDSASSELLKNGDTLNSRKEMTLEEEFNVHLDPLKEKAQKLISTVESIIVDVNTLWDTSASYVIEESMYEAREAIDTYMQLAHNLTDLINRETQLMTTIVENINQVKDTVMTKMNSFTEISSSITKISGDFTSSGIAVEMNQLNKSMFDVNLLIVEIKNGGGTLGALTQSTEFKEALESTEQSMESLMNDITADPMKYIGLSIFGKKIKGVQLTKEEEKILKDWLAR